MLGASEIIGYTGRFVVKVAHRAAHNRTGAELSPSLYRSFCCRGVRCRGVRLVGLTQANSSRMPAVCFELAHVIFLSHVPDFVAPD